MNPVFRYFSLLTLLALLVACDDANDRLSELGGPTMGTTWSVKFTGTPSGGVPALRQSIEAALEQVNADMSTYREDATISRFNRAESGEAVTVSADFATVLKQALSISQATGGAYDVTVGPLVNLWGFGPDSTHFEPPPAREIEAARARVGWHQLVLDGNQLVQPGAVYLDLSSIAKGFAVDKLAGVLEQAGIRNYLLEIGGELRASGKKPYQQPWRIAVERPIAGVRETEKIIALHDLSVATSGDYRNFFEADGKIYSHTIDPRTGYPVGHQLGSVTVLHSSAMVADGLATALTVLGPEKGLAFAQQRELPVLFIVRGEGGPKEIMTSTFRRLLEAEGG